MKKLLFVTDTGVPTSVGALQQLLRLIRDALGAVSGYELETVNLAEVGGARRATLCQESEGHVAGATPGMVFTVVESVRQVERKQGSLYFSNPAPNVQGLRAALQNVEMLTFFHNGGARFFFGLLLKYLSLRALGILIGNFLADRLAVRPSEKLICLIKRDRKQLQALYGRSGTHLLPMMVQDQPRKDLAQVLQPPAEKHALFVGGTFYANRQGVEWYFDNADLRALSKTYAVGKGFERWKERLERNGNIEVIGGADSRATWSLGAHVVIVPLFDGSGMRSKAAEALMSSNRILGTKETFPGCEAAAGLAGECRQSSDQFLESLAREAVRPYPTLHGVQQSIYWQQYSMEAARARLKGILGGGPERAG